MPDTANTGLMQCEDCGHHFQVSPRGEVQVASCPDCGGKRLFRMQPNPVQSEGTLRNMVDMETGKDAGGNPDGEGILAPPSGRSILTAFGEDVRTCAHCGWNSREQPSDEGRCPKCQWPFEAENSNGIPDELRGQIAGAPLTEGTIMQTEHTDPLDTGAHGRDEYTHGSVLRVFAAQQIPCADCGLGSIMLSDGTTYCPNCKHATPPAQRPAPFDIHQHSDLYTIPSGIQPPKGPGLLQRMFAANGEHQGYTNWETWHTKAMLDNDRHLHEQQKRMSEGGWTPEQIRNWTVKHVIGPENKRKLEDAQKWNEIPEPDRTDPHYEEIADKSPQHKDIMESWFGGPDVSDTTPNLIDPELVNWDEIHHNIHAEHDEEQQYRDEDHRLKGEGLVHGMPGYSDETNKMLDAWMKHHGVMDENTPHYDNPIMLPIDHLEKGYGQYTYPQDFGEPHVAEIAQQGGWKEPIRDLGWHTLHRIQKGLETPYTETMHQALVGQGYPPEQIQHIMRPQWRQVPGEVPDGPIGGKPGVTWERIEQKPEPGPDPRLDQPGKDVFPTEWTSKAAGRWEDLPGGEQQFRKDDPRDHLHCPQCHEPIMGDSQAKSIFCPNCAQEWPIHGDEGFIPQYILPDQKQWSRYPIPLIDPELENMNLGPIHQGRVAGEMGGVTFGETPTMKNEFLKWTPGMVGGGLVIAGQPHTWNRYDPNQHGTDGLQLELGPGHQEYVKSLGIDPKHVDWKNATHIQPNGELPDEFKRKDLSPFIAADPRLKLVEEKISPGSTMPTHSRTNNMEPYETLWAVEDDMRLEPREAGLWGDVAAAALPVAGLALAPETGGASLALDAGEAGALLGGEAAGAGAAAAGGEAAGAAADLGTQGTKAAGGLMSKAMSGAGGLAKAEGISDLAGQGLKAGEGALGIGGGGQAGGGGGAGYSGPLQQFTHVLAAFVESDYETPASNPDVGVKHDDPEDVDQKEFNDQDKNPENLLNPNLQDSGASGEDQVRDDAGKPSQGQFAPDSPAIQRLDMLMPLIEKYYHSEESGANDPMLKELHEQLEAEVPGYLNQADPELAERLMQHRKGHPEHVHASTKQAGPYTDFGENRSFGERRRFDDELDDAWATKNGERRVQDRRVPILPQAIQCPACQAGQLVGPACNNCGTTIESILSQPTSRDAHIKEAIMPPMQQGNLQAQQQALDPTGLNPSLQPQAPSSAAPPGGGAQGGHCKNCGSVTQANGACPQCGANNQQAENAAPLPGGPSVAPNPQMFSHMDLLAAFADRQGANHQGPVTPEQVAAVQQYLIQKGRVDEVPNVPLDPGNPEYAKILAEIQQNPENVPTVTPEEQTQPPAPQPQAPGGMPVPGMAPGEAGGQPMQPMSSFLPELDFTHTGADNIAPRCPKCNSATTGLVGDEEHHAKCHSCHNIWKLNDVLSDENYGQTSIAKTLMNRYALRDERQHGGQGEQANPVGVPAADQSQQVNQGGDEDSSLTWQDTAGTPLKAGQTYQMINPAYSLPDLVRVERVKPDGLDVTLLGTFANDPSQHDPGTLTSSTPISKEDADLQQLSFEPVNQTADDQNNEPPPGTAAPGTPQIPPSGQTTDEHSAQEPNLAHVKHDSDCPRCGRMEFTSSMISPEATEHNCFRCGHDWVTEERPDEHLGGTAQRENWTNPSAEWLNEDEDAEDFLTPRRADMARQQVQSRSLGDIAERDDRLRATREYLAREGVERQERLAGKHFSPREQRELIDEDGFARNSDMLDLEGTHYTGRDDYESKTNPERVRDSDLFLGI